MNRDRWIKYKKWYFKLFLWILPSHKMADQTDRNKHVMVYKKWRGKTYILKTYKE